MFYSKLNNEMAKSVCVLDFRNRSIQWESTVLIVSSC